MFWQKLLTGFYTRHVCPVFAHSLTSQRMSLSKYSTSTFLSFQTPSIDVIHLATFMYLTADIYHAPLCHCCMLDCLGFKSMPGQKTGKISALLGMVLLSSNEYTDHSLSVGMVRRQGRGLICRG